MSKQHRYLLGLITLASVVTIVFQCFWLYGNYQHEKDNFISYAERLLFESMQEEREAAFRKEYPNSTRSLIVGDFVGPARPSYGVTKEKQVPLNIKNRGDMLKSGLDVTAKDTMHIQFLPTVPQLDFKMLQKRYREKLDTDLADAFFLDTSYIQRLEMAHAAPRPPMPMKGGIAVRAPFLPPDLGKPNQKVLVKFPVQATTMMLDPTRDLFLTLYLKTPTWWIIKKLAFTFMASLLLTSLTIGCLVYLLYTIFKQKKLADIKNDFVNNMTHELKTPLATVLAATESLQQFSFEESPKKADLYLQMTHRAATHLTNLIDQILHLAVGEKKGMHLRTEPVDINHLLQQVIETHQLINQHQISLTIEEKIPLIHIDKMHIVNAINNLLDNAVKYTIDPIKLLVISKVVNKQWMLRIVDNGIGIAPSDIKHIFQPFYRVPTGNIHRIKGFGLGLHYVKQVITQHKGHIEVYSTPGEGTTFTIYLPLSI